jgi:sugar phosphate isomerase/epimerase
MAVSGRIGFPAMRKILADNDMTYVELEIISDWYAEGERRAKSDKVRADILRAAEQLGARHVKICGDVQQGHWETPRLVETFRDLCAEATHAGTLIALELMPFTNIRTIELGLEIVKGAGAKNGGLMFDIWHIARGKIPFDKMKAFPKELLSWVEIDDADAQQVGTLWEDTLFHRKLCGEGALDVPAFIKAIRAIGYSGAYGVEIISETHRRLPLAVAAQRSFDTAIKQFEKMG